MLLGWRDGDVDVAPGLLVGLAERDVARDDLVQGPLPRLFHEAGAEPVAQHVGDAYLLHGHVALLAEVSVRQLLVAVDAELSRHRRAGAGAGDDVREQPVLEQLLHHAVVEVDEPRTAREE